MGLINDFDIATIRQIHCISVTDAIKQNNYNVCVFFVYLSNLLNYHLLEEPFITTEKSREM